MALERPAKRKRELPGSKPQFAFVHSLDSTGQLKDNGTLQRTVRSYAMQYARRQKRWSTTKKASVPTPAPSTKDDSRQQDRGKMIILAVPSYHHGSEPSRPSVRSRKSTGSDTRANPPGTDICLSCWQTPKAGLSCRCSVGNILAINFMNHDLPQLPRHWDPPVMLSPGMAPLTRSETELLSIFFSSIGPRFLPLDARHQSALMMGWLAACLSHSAYMHSLCSVSAMYLLISGKGRLQDVIYHKMRAEAFINLNLIDPVRRLEDPNIGAVFNLMCVNESLLLPSISNVESRKSDAVERVVHLNGLRHLINLRGGISGIDSKCLRTFILWHSTAQAVASFRDPYLSFIEHLTRSVDSLCPLDKISLRTTQHRMVQKCSRLFVSDELIQIVGNTTQFVDALNLWHGRGPNCLDFLDLINWSCAIIQRLLLHINSRPGSPVEESLAIALVMFTSRASESIARTIDPLKFTALDRLRDSLMATSPSDWAPATDLYLWVCAIGVLAAANDDEQRNWFISRCQHISHDAPQSSVVLAQVRHCLWIERSMGQPFRKQ